MHMRILSAALAFCFISVLSAPATFAKAPVDIQLTSEGDHLLKGKVNADANQVQGKTTIHIHGKKPIVMDQQGPHFEETLKGLEKGHTYKGSVTFYGTVAGKKVTVEECFQAEVGTEEVKLVECEEDKVTIPEKPDQENPDEENQPDDGDQPKDGEKTDDNNNQPKDNQKSPEDRIDNAKGGGEMPDTATSEPIQLLIGSMTLLAGGILWKFRSVAS
ncbi:hypothetical protein [Paludifilum halophilum]|uniref:Gram-positive cocci surface proteins LPxTG domain-containing protein n=1 Tax=Paludifilum halophilum TaxID=1642702 RepID=A0A235B1T4_9BACL|nr:hypothetical protein [Paludifilum halophilum]OYD06270.1 hypothetical protein CHM34_17045 [Paludifilum halophilum]